MKYIIELEGIEGTDLYRVKGTSSHVFDEMEVTSALKPLPRPEVDWSEVKVDTPILVSTDAETWERRHFAKYEDGEVRAWNNGHTSFTENNSLIWKYAKLAEV